MRTARVNLRLETDGAHADYTLLVELDGERVVMVRPIAVELLGLRDCERGTTAVRRMLSFEERDALMTVALAFARSSDVTMRNLVTLARAEIDARDATNGVASDETPQA